MTTPARALRGHRRGDRWFGMALAAPALLVTLALLVYPLLSSFWVSLHDLRLSGGEPARFVGLRNYVEVVQAPLFWPSLWRTVLFALGVTVLTTAFGIGFALVLDGDFWGRGLLRGLMILPWSLSQTTLALTIGWIFNSTFGPLNGALFDLGLIDEYISWFADGGTVLAVVGLGIVWSLTPFATLLFLGALQTVPQEQLKAARVDGAGAVRRFLLVVVPHIRETALIVVVLAALNGFLVFAPIYILTGGGPGTDTTMLAWWGYRTGFRDLNLGQSAAIFYIMTLLVMATAVITVFALGRRRAT
ncbi:carbohydrate ABC transporter permease [Phytohabitans kaempferiae]|uniref:Carbohydrate ABC transporter permease n=1 Tax=Phytohabitans kaempferiae TaxID=1620943 RepID=A0ABV6M782_9ACTN